jgi:uncharacterized protein
MGKPLLLDVNALVALGWPNHQFHRRIRERLEQEPYPGWATCGLTQLGFVRISANPSAVGQTVLPRHAAGQLAALTSDVHHRYLADSVPPVAKQGMFDPLVGHGQVTDAYLVGLAAEHDCTLLTFDRRLAAIPAGPGRVECL